MVKNRTYFEHHCDLPSSDVMIEIPPYLPKFKKWIRLMRRYLTVNEHLPRTKKFYRSYAAIMAEKRRHADNYPSTIHPFSTAAIYRERILCFLWLINTVTEPIINSFSIIKEAIDIVPIVLDFMFFINIFVTVYCGYYDTSRRKVILCPKTILKQKFFTYLLPEFICCIPLVLMMKSIVGTRQKSSRLPLLFISIKFLRCLRLVDYFRYLNNFLQDMNFQETLYSWVVAYFINLYCTIWLSCALFTISITVYTYNGLPANSFLRNRAPQGMTGSNIIRPENNFQDTFVTLLTVSTCHFFGASEGYVPIELVVEKIMCSFVLMSGYIISIFVTARLLQISGASNISEIKYEELSYQVEEYARLKKLPAILKKRLDIYHEYKFQRRYFKEEVILSTLSEHLRNEVILYGCRNVLDKVPLFQGIMKGVIGSVLGFMKKEIYLPDDIVLKYGEPLTKMFFVSYGTLSVHYGLDDVEILHFEDGDHFGDLSITKLGGEAKLTVVALEITEIFTLSRKDVKHCTDFLKEMSEKVVKYSNDKYQLYRSLTQAMTNENVLTTLADLNRGRILERDLRRRKQ